MDNILSIIFCSANPCFGESLLLPTLVAMIVAIPPISTSVIVTGTNTSAFVPGLVPTQASELSSVPF